MIVLKVHGGKRQIQCDRAAMEMSKCCEVAKVAQLAWKINTTESVRVYENVVDAWWGMSNGL